MPPKKREVSLVVPFRFQGGFHLVQEGPELFTVHESVFDRSVARVQRVSESDLTPVEDLQVLADQADGLEEIFRVNGLYDLRTPVVISPALDEEETDE